LAGARCPGVMCPNLLAFSLSQTSFAKKANGNRHRKAVEADFGAEIRVRADFTLSRGSQAIRRETGMPRPVMMLMTLQATLASVFCVGRVRA